MKKFLCAVCALALSAAMLTGCGCSNVGTEPTVMPTTQPTTRATTAPATQSTTVPATVPTTEATMLPTETGSNETNSTNGATDNTEAANNSRSRNRAPAQNGQ